MLLGFKRQFAQFVEEGSKTHTIRAPRVIQPKVGEICHCYVDPRQKSMRLLGRWPCVRVEPITLDFVKYGMAYVLRITIADQILSMDEASSFAWADGFRSRERANMLRTEKTASLDEMANFWIASKRLTDSLNSTPWRGTVIHWQR
jgi:hypothetical protein